jgi:hypothetical protein
MATDVNTPGFVSGYGTPADVSGERETDAYSGIRDEPMDPTLEKGNYGPSNFGVDLPQGTGAPGSQGAQFGADTDPTTQPGQLDEGISGEGPAQTAHTGAPGSAGASASTGTGPDAVRFTMPNAGLGTNKQLTVQDSVSGPQDWTQVNDSGYGSGGPQLPGLPEPVSTGAGAGSVLRGGRFHG